MSCTCFLSDSCLIVAGMRTAGSRHCDLWCSYREAQVCFARTHAQSLCADLPLYTVRRFIAIGWPLRRVLVSSLISLILILTLIYLLTAIGLTHGGSSTVHIYTQTVHRTTQNKQYIEQHNNLGRVRAVPRLG